MAELWIQEEEITEEFLDGTGHHIRRNGNIKSVYFLCEGTEGDYVENNKRFLQDFLIAQEKYPLYLTFITYDDNTDECISFFKKNEIDYTLIHLEEKRTYYTAFKKHHYQPPCFTVKIKDLRSLILVLEETYWLPTQNEFYAIAYSDNLLFRLGNVIEWGKKKERSIAIFNTDEETTFITIFHDGNGFYLFSNQEKYLTLEGLCANLPKRTVITQINDTLVKRGSIEEE